MNFTETGEHEFSVTAIADDENVDYKNSLPSPPVCHFVFSEFDN